MNIQKRIIQLFFMSMLICSANCYSQGLYFGVGGGYGFASATVDWNPDTTMQTTGNPPNSTTTITTRSNPVSFGRGVLPGIYAGYMLTKNIGAELDISYLFGMNNVSNKSFSSTWPKNYTRTEIETVRGNMLRFTPSIRLQLSEGDIQPYARVGVIIGALTRLRHEIKYTDSISVQDYVYIYTGGVSWGFSGAFGVNFKLGEKLGIFAEVVGNYQSWSPSHRNMKTATYNGADILNTFSIRDKQLDYQSSSTTNSATPLSPDSPMKVTAIFLPYSSIGINIGIHILFGAKQ